MYVVCWEPRKAERLPPPHDWSKVHGDDLPVCVLINWNDNSIVFLDEDLDVDYHTVTAFDEQLKKPEVGKVLARIQALQAVPISRLSYETRLAFRKMLGEALDRAFHDDHRNTKTLLDSANEFVAARNQELGRRWFICSSLSVTSFIVAIGLWMWVDRTALNAKFSTQFMSLVVACSAGAVGSLFSVLNRLSKIPLDPSAGFFQHFVEGIGHIIAGMIGGIVVYLAMKAGIFYPKLLELGVAGQMLGCMVGGMSERLVPTIIRKVDLTAADTGKHEK